MRRVHNLSPHRKRVKRYLKFLAVNKHHPSSVEVIKHAPVDVLKAISNACINVASGQVQVSPAHKRKFSKYRGQIGVLSTKSHTIKQRRQILVQEGGFAFITLLLSLALSTLGNQLFGG